MIDFNQFRELTTEVLQEMESYSETAVTAIMMIVGHESLGGTYIKQVKGPALGVIQMEPATHDSLWDNSSIVRKKAELMGIKRNVKALQYDLRYNIFMARCLLAGDPKPLPATIYSLSSYLKRVYNSPLGKATNTSYARGYAKWAQL